MKTLQHCQESFCNSYLGAVAAAARHQISFAQWGHDYGVDGSFALVEKRGSRIAQTGFTIDFQAKASTSWIEDNDLIKYDLEAKAYNDLIARIRSARTSPFYLVLFCMPREVPAWATFTEEHLILKRCAYFYRPDGEPTPNEATVRISIPRENRLTPDTLTDLLNKVKSGDLLP